MRDGKINEFHASIDPVTDGQPRPLWSVLIPCYNCARFLEQTLESVLCQDPGPEVMEILVIDDHSTLDDPAEVVERWGKGRVRFIRQERNVGKVRNYETGLQASRGHLIHQLHGDDLVLPGFYTAMEKAFERHPEAGAFFCESDYITEAGEVVGRTGVEREETGILPNWLQKIVAAQRIQTPSMVVRREVYETLGGFDRRLDCSEDWEMWIRIATGYPIGFCVETRARYRTSAGNNSTRSILNGSRGSVQRRMFRIVDEYLPRSIVEETRSQRELNQAFHFASNISSVISRGKFRSWLSVCIESLRFSARPAVIRRILSLTVRSMAGKTRGR